LSYSKVAIKVDSIQRLTQETLDRVAKFDLIIMSLPANWNKLAIEYIQGVNPRVAIFGYVPIGGMWANQITELEYMRSQGWLLKDSEGNEWDPDPKYGDKIGYDIGNSDCRAWIINRIKQQISELCNITGMFGDGTNTYIPLPTELRPINPRTNALYTDKEWNADMVAFVNDFHRLVSKPWLANGAGLLGARQYHPNQVYADPVIDVVDGILIEGWIRWENQDLRPEAEWKANLDFLQSLVNKGKFVLAWTIGYGNIPEPLTLDQVLMYGLCSHRLVTTPKTLFALSCNNLAYELDHYTLMRTNLSYPTKPYQKRTDVPVYERDFQQGKVLVNSTTSEQIVRLGRSYKTLEGRTVTEVTMPAKTGVILKKNDAFRWWL